MNIPFSYDSGFLILGTGFLYGYFLEVSEMGSPHKLNVQFTFEDWAVFKVMFVAVLVATAGLWLLNILGFLELNTLKIPTPYYFAIAIGGTLLGSGLTIGGYCSGTSVVGVFSGRLDGLFSMLGLLLVTALFALFFPWIEPLFLAVNLKHVVVGHYLQMN